MMRSRLMNSPGAEPVGTTSGGLLCDVVLLGFRLAGFFTMIEQPSRPDFPRPPDPIDKPPPDIKPVPPPDIPPPAGPPDIQPVIPPDRGEVPSI